MVHNWSVDEKAFKKADLESYKIWRIQQMINYGLDGERLSRKEVKKKGKGVRPSDVRFL